MAPTPAVLVLVLLLAGLAPHDASAAAASANAISCYTSVPRAPGQRPAATPVAYPKKDGYSACLRYQYRCTVDSATCLASEIGSWKYHYYGSSVQQCRAILGNALRMGLRTVFCCTADKCNAPDPRRDPATQLLPESWLSRARPTAPRMSPLSGAAPLAAAPSDNAVASNATLPVPAMPVAAAAPERDMACWYSLPSAPSQPQEAALLEVETGAPLCVRWELRCSVPSTACSQADVAARAWRWVYGSVDKASCDAIKSGRPGTSSKGVRNTFCCSNPGCNKPDNKLDGFTKVRKEAAESAAVAGAQQLAMLPMAGGGLAMQQPVMVTAVGGAAQPGAASGSSRSWMGSSGWSGGLSRSNAYGGTSWSASSSGSSESSTKDGSAMSG